MQPAHMPGFAAQEKYRNLFRVLGVVIFGRTVDDQTATAAAAAAGPYCRSCGVRNDPDARFCDGCGQSLA